MYLLFICFQIQCETKIDELSGNCLGKGNITSFPPWRSRESGQTITKVSRGKYFFPPVIDGFSIQTLPDNFAGKVDSEPKLSSIKTTPKAKPGLVFYFSSGKSAKTTQTWIFLRNTSGRAVSAKFNKQSPFCHSNSVFSVSLIKTSFSS